MRRWIEVRYDRDTELETMSVNKKLGSVSDIEDFVEDFLWNKPEVFTVNVVGSLVTVRAIFWSDYLNPKDVESEVSLWCASPEEASEASLLFSDVRVDSLYEQAE